MNRGQGKKKNTRLYEHLHVLPKLLHRGLQLFHRGTQLIERWRVTSSGEQNETRLTLQAKESKMWKWFSSNSLLNWDLVAFAPFLLHIYSFLSFSFPSCLTHVPKKAPCSVCHCDDHICELCKWCWQSVQAAWSVAWNPVSRCPFVGFLSGPPMDFPSVSESIFSCWALIRWHIHKTWQAPVHWGQTSKPTKTKQTTCTLKFVSPCLTRDRGVSWKMSVRIPIAGGYCAGSWEHGDGGDDAVGLTQAEESCWRVWLAKGRAFLERNLLWWMRLSTLFPSKTRTV